MMLVESVVATSDEAEAVAALGEVPGIEGHSWSLHVSGDVDSAEGAGWTVVSSSEQFVCLGV